MLRRGFKTQAERISAELRAELGLTLHDRLGCAGLAEHLCIPVDPITVLGNWGARDDDLRVVAGPSGCVSAMTVYRGARCRVLYNPHHSAARTASSIAHELSHVILEHEPRPPIGADGRLNIDPVQEAEAEWQAGSLLVPREGALRLLSLGAALRDGAEHFGVSLELFSWRAHQTGVVRQLHHRSQRAA